MTATLCVQAPQKLRRPLAHAAKVTYQWERFADAIHEALPLLKKNWEETGDGGDFEPNFDQYFAMERAGVIKFFSARRDGALIGYLSIFVTPELHCTRRKTAISDAFWVHPLEREGWVGYKLLSLCEEGLREFGVSRIDLMPKIDFKNDNGYSVSSIMKRLKYTPHEIRYVKIIGE